jgi:hypothetical protein
MLSRYQYGGCAFFGGVFGLPLLLPGDRFGDFGRHSGLCSVDGEKVTGMVSQRGGWRENRLQVNIE